jgi:hypothetical protein
MREAQLVPGPDRPPAGVAAEELAEWKSVFAAVEPSTVGHVWDLLELPQRA